MISNESLWSIEPNGHDSIKIVTPEGEVGVGIEWTTPGGKPAIWLDDISKIKSSVGGTVILSEEDAIRLRKWVVDELLRQGVEVIDARDPSMRLSLADGMPLADFIKKYRINNDPKGNT